MPPAPSVPEELYDRLRILESDLKSHVAECTILRKQFVDIASDVRVIRDTTIRRGAWVACLLFLAQIVTAILAYNGNAHDEPSQVVIQ